LDRKIKQPDPENIKQAKQELNELRKIMKVKETIDDLQEQLTTRNFKPPKQRPKVEISPELRKLNTEAKSLKSKIYYEMELDRKLTFGEKVFDVLDVMRTEAASSEISFWMRQGGQLMWSNPQLMVEGLVKNTTAFFSQNSVDEINNLLKSDVDFERAVSRGVKISEHMGAGEEQFMNKFIARLVKNHPGTKALFINTIASERAATAYINWLRLTNFKMLLRAFPNTTVEEEEAWADFTNKTTGWGDAKSLGRSITVANKILFSTRFTLSRFQTPLTVVKYWKLPRVRSKILRSLMRAIILQLSALMLLDIAGFDVDWNPRSPDFLKIKISNTRFDIFYGALPLARLIIRLLDSIGQRFDVWEEPTGVRQATWKDNITDFIAYKLHPAISVTMEILTGKDIMGKDVSFPEAALHTVTPFVARDTWEAWHDEGIITGLPAFLMSSGGHGVATFYDSRTKRMSRIKEAKKSGDPNTAYRLKRDWNERNPEKKIN